jgi:hypothetical protein
VYRGVEPERGAAPVRGRLGVEEAGRHAHPAGRPTETADDDVADRERPGLVADGAAHVADALGERIVPDDDVGPDRGQQFVAADHPAGVPDQMDEHGERFRTAVDRAVRGGEDAAPEVEHPAGEPVDRAVLLGHRVPLSEILRKGLRIA